MTRELATAYWPDLEPGRATVAVPVGALEQHGPHLPLDTDTRIARALTAALPGVLVAPALEYGSSGEHEGFPGTVSLGAEAMETVLVEYGRSVCRWAARLLFVNWHGGNVHPLTRAVSLLRYEGRDVAWLPFAVPGGDAHAGVTETSLLLHLDPRVVDTARAEKGNTGTLADLMPRMREGGIVAVSANGVLGDPTPASAAQGARWFAELVDRATAQVTRWEPDGKGRLR
ncbi:mycofactocin biosynthesis peptidyl-dipeptidase MftE [Rhodococcus sp. 2H158]